MGSRAPSTALTWRSKCSVAVRRRIASDPADSFELAALSITDGPFSAYAAGGVREVVVIARDGIPAGRGEGCGKKHVRWMR